MLCTNALYNCLILINKSYKKKIKTAKFLCAALTGDALLPPPLFAAPSAVSICLRRQKNQVEKHWSLEYAAHVPPRPTMPHS